MFLWQFFCYLSFSRQFFILHPKRHCTSNIQARTKKYWSQETNTLIKLENKASKYLLQPRVDFKLAIWSSYYCSSKWNSNSKMSITVLKISTPKFGLCNRRQNVATWRAHLGILCWSKVGSRCSSDVASERLSLNGE